MIENLYAVRINRGLSQKQLAEMCDVTQQFIQRIEKGKVNPSVPTIKKLALVLGVTVDELIGKKAG